MILHLLWRWGSSPVLSSSNPLSALSSALRDHEFRVHLQPSSSGAPLFWELSSFILQGSLACWFDQLFVPPLSRFLLLTCFEQALLISSDLLFLSTASSLFHSGPCRTATGWLAGAYARMGGDLRRIELLLNESVVGAKSKLSDANLYIAPCVPIYSCNGIFSHTKYTKPFTGQAPIFSHPICFSYLDFQWDYTSVLLSSHLTQYR